MDRIVDPTHRKLSVELIAPRTIFMQAKNYTKLNPRIVV